MALRAALDDALDPGGRVAVEDRHVLGQGERLGGPVEIVEVEIIGTPLGVVQLGTGHLERGA